MKIYVGNLSFQTQDSDLHELFAGHGQVTSARVIMDRDTNRSKGFGFVEMGSDDEASNAIAALDGVSMDSRTLKVNEAKPREERAPAGARRY